MVVVAVVDIGDDEDDDDDSGDDADIVVIPIVGWTLSLCPPYARKPSTLPSDFFFSFLFFSFILNAVL